MNEHEKALPAGGPAKLTQNAVKIYVISSRERLLLPLAFCFCLLLVNTLLWSGPTAGLTASVCVWYGLLGLYLGRTLLNTWESRVLLAVNLAAPILAAELLGQVGMGILMKVIPQINVFAINIELKVIIGLALLMLFMAPVSEFLLDAENEMLLAVRNMLELLGA